MIIPFFAKEYRPPLKINCKSIALSIMMLLNRFENIGVDGNYQKLDSYLKTNICISHLENTCAINKIISKTINL